MKYSQFLYQVQVLKNGGATLIAPRTLIDFIAYAKKEGYQEFLQALQQDEQPNGWFYIKLNRGAAQ